MDKTKQSSSAMDDPRTSAPRGSAFDHGSSGAFNLLDESTAFGGMGVDKNPDKKVLAAEETLHVRRFKALMLLALLVFCVVVSGLTYMYARDMEEHEFESVFLSNGNKVIDAFQEDSLRKMQALFSLSSAITSYAMSSNSTWPFVTVPNSGREFAPYLSLADAAALTIFPIVPRHLRAEWEYYTEHNQQWIDQDLAMMNTAAITSTAANSDQADQELGKDFTAKITPYIKNYVGVDTSPGIWTPWWQYYPVIPNRWFVNFNRLAWKGFDQQVATVTSGKATLSETTAFEPGLDFQSTKDFDFFSELLQAGGSGNSYDAGEPLSYISYPIFSQFFGSSPSSNIQENSETNPAVAAVLTATVYWKTYFQGILPDDVNGIICVVSNSVNQVFTYELNGRQATFLGMQDYHDPKYKHMKLSAGYSFATSSAASNLTNGGIDGIEYTGVPIDDKLAYKLEIYPSQVNEDSHSTNNPIYFALAIACVFVLCAIIFLIYNKLVDRRQELVYNTAIKSTAVVDSMFPENVRDRLLESAAQDKSDTGKKSNPVASVFQAGENKEQKLLHDQALGGRQSSAPIADHFEGTTIFFADIKGFTKWCDNRQPAEVFTLLETLYGEFDEIAKRRRVYKVETVGDCYVACTGLPVACHDHALVISRFSLNVLAKFSQVIHRLEDTLGDTNQLGLRIGLHSGPTTAGVIRGQNARFQLFGDTVNTASRMESTGEGGKIQISQSTADLLSDVGKKSWFIPREDKVFAKGKGELQTYWLVGNGKGAGSNLSGSGSGSQGKSLSRSDTDSCDGSIEEDMASGDLSFLENALKRRIDENKASPFRSSQTGVVATEGTPDSTMTEIEC